jgi:hypothetical protein
MPCIGNRSGQPIINALHDIEQNAASLLGPRRM